MSKIKRSRTGCFNCKQRRRKCDETKPTCLNCATTGRECGYGIRLSFDVDDSRHSKFLTLSNGRMKYGFRGRPRLGDTLSKTKDTTNGEHSKPPKSTGDNIPPVELVKEESVTSEAISVLPSNQVLELGMMPYKSYPMQAASSLEGLSGSTVFENSDIHQDTFNFIHQGLDYLLNGLQATEYFGRGNNGTSTAVPSENNAVADVPALDSDGMPTATSLIRSRTGSPSVRDQFSNMNNDNLIDQEDGIDATEILSFMDNANLYPSSAVSSLSYSDENLMLRHFFNRLLPLLDAHPNNPWPELALRYCDFEIARSCFLSLSCMHLYGRKGGKQYYRTGMIHMNSTMSYLVRYIKNTGTLENEKLNIERKYKEDIENDINVDRIVGDLKDETINQKRSSFFVILILIYVQILFAILEEGKSLMSRIFFKLFATIANDPIFKAVLENIDQSQTTICVLSWYDTITAMASPDCRLPYCNPLWYGNKHSDVSLAKMVGCPGEIFASIAKICQFRLDLKENKLSDEEILLQYNSIKYDLINYREYVVLRLNQNELVNDDSVELKPEDEYDVRLRGAQCWALSALVKLDTIVKFDDSQERIETLINEFIMCYGSMDPECTTVVQMVWPIFNIGSECKTQKQRDALQIFIDRLDHNGQTGTIRTLKKLVEQSWRTGESMTHILSGKDWLQSGTDFLPV